MVGIPFWSFLAFNATFAEIYRFRAIFSFLTYRRREDPVTKEVADTSPHKLYKFIMNSSLAAYILAEDLNTMVVTDAYFTVSPNGLMYLTLLRTAMAGVRRFAYHRSLCSQRLEDPVCRELYNTCYPIDPDFAENGLSFCIGA